MKDNPPAASTVSLAVRLAFQSASDMGHPVYVGTVRHTFRVAASWECDPTAGPRIPGRFHGPYTLRTVYLWRVGEPLAYVVRPDTSKTGSIVGRALIAPIVGR